MSIKPNKSIYVSRLVMTAISLGLFDTATAQSSATPPSSRPSENALTMTLKPNLMKTEAGKPVELHLTVSNPTKRPLWFLQRDPNAEFAFSVKDASGQQVRYTAAGEIAAQNSGIARGSYRRTLQPGDFVVYTVRLNVLYDLTLPSRYQVSASYVSMSPEGTAPDVGDSNIILLTITDADLPAPNAVPSPRPAR